MLANPLPWGEGDPYGAFTSLLAYVFGRKPPQDLQKVLAWIAKA